jgi:hypothetical protein
VLALVSELGLEPVPVLVPGLAPVSGQHSRQQTVSLLLLPERWHRVVLTIFYSSLFPPIKILVCEPEYLIHFYIIYTSFIGPATKPDYPQGSGHGRELKCN